MTQHLFVVEAAAQAHTDGLNAALAGEFDTAHTLFVGGLSLLRQPAGMRQTPATVVQEARLIRDDGFTFTRQANAEVDPLLCEGYFADAVECLTESVDMTRRVTGVSRQSPHGRPVESLTELQTREALSEHAMTGGLLGVTVIARTVSLNRVDHSGKSPRREIMDGLVRIIKAYELAQHGTNIYYVGRLARLALRGEQLYGRPHTALWLGRITASAAQASIHDKANAPQAWGQLEKARRQALSYASALAATHDWRTV
jgi:hypothetical protein